MTIQLSSKYKYATINSRLVFVPNLWVSMKVNDKIRFLREKQGWSQEYMSEKLNMSTNGYSKIERGETRLTIPKLEQISEVFDIDILELMTLGERNILFFQESDNNFSNSIINASQDLASEILRLKEAIAYKDEIIAQKNAVIEAQQRENELLRNQLKL